MKLSQPCVLCHYLLSKILKLVPKNTSHMRVVSSISKLHLFGTIIIHFLMKNRGCIFTVHTDTLHKDVSYVSMCLCVYMFMGLQVHVCAHVCSCMWRPKVSITYFYWSPSWCLRKVSLPEPEVCDSARLVLCASFL